MRWISCRLIIFLLASANIYCNDQSYTLTNSNSHVDTGKVATLAFEFTRAQVIRLKKKLKEISGIAYIGDNRFAAVQDETGVIYIIDYSSGEVIESIEFAGKGDFEDIAVDKDFYYVLESSGTIYRVPRNGTNATTNYSLPGKKKREFESLCLGEDGKNLVMLCKECKHEDDLKEGFCFNLQSLEFQKNACLSIDLREIKSTLPSGTLLRPSAATINKADNKLYVLCSVGKKLLRCSLDGRIEQSFPLDPALFRQPEGLAFTPSGELFISNEAAGEQATLVRIPVAKP